MLRVYLTVMTCFSFCQIGQFLSNAGWDPPQFGHLTVLAQGDCGVDVWPSWLQTEQIAGLVVLHLVW
jgi:hypothetical protein